MTDPVASAGALVRRPRRQRQRLGAAIIATLTPTRGGRPLTVPLGVDNARYRLARALAKLDGCRTLVVTLAEGRIIPPSV